MNFDKWSYRDSEELIPIVTVKSLEKVLAGVNLSLTRGCSQSLRETILNELLFLGWSDRVRISAKRAITITALNQDTALCLQTGNMARFYADLLKLQALQLDGKISAAIYILPVKLAAKKMGQNLANFERLKDELEFVYSKAITIPLLVYGLGFN